MPIVDFTDLVADMVRDQSNKISLAEMTTAVDMAVAKYSKDYPRQVVIEVTGTGTDNFDKPVDAIAILSIETPENIQNPNIDFCIRQTPTGAKVYFTEGQSLPAGEIVWLKHTALHLLTSGLDTIPTTHQEPIAHYATAKLLEDLAAASAGDQNDLIQADSVNHESKSSIYAKRARRHFDLYHSLLGIKPGRQKSASATVNWNSSGDFVQHPGSER